jgi:hypothetical protein
MPITQDRMIALARAAHDAKSKLSALQAQCHQAMTHTDADAALAAISAFIPHTLLSQANSDRIAIELEHFSHVKTKNMRSAERMKRLRASASREPEPRQRKSSVVEAPEKILAAIDEGEALPALLEPQV